MTRIDGTRAPGISERLAMRSRRLCMTASTRVAGCAVRPDSWSAICTAPCLVQFVRIVLIRSLPFPVRKWMLKRSGFTYRRTFMDKLTSGWLSGLIGVLIFSGSLPATRIAVQGLDPVFLTVARATIAGTLGLLLLLTFRETR